MTKYISTIERDPITREELTIVEMKHNEPTNEGAINKLIKGSVDTNKISDGYHTFGELYEHRIRLFIALCKIKGREWSNEEFSSNVLEGLVWRTEPVDGWFVLGINREKGKQITYHLPVSYYEEIKNTAILMTPLGKDFDGHTSADVLERLKKL